MIKNYNIVVNGVSYSVQVEELGSNYSSGSENMTKPQPEIKLPPKQETKAPVNNINVAPSGGSGVSAPMPGTIIDVKVNVGDSVKKGQVLCILEAMKMENEIMASYDGKITGVSVSKGSSVSTGDLLVSIG